MKGILIRIIKGHKLKGEGEQLGKDSFGNVYTFWKSMGHMEVSLDLAIRLEREKPKRYEIVDRIFADKILNELTIEKNISNTNDNNIIFDLVLNQVEKIIDLNKSEQIELLNKLNISYDKYAKEFDRVRKIILSGYKL